MPWFPPGSKLKDPSFQLLANIVSSPLSSNLPLLEERPQRKGIPSAIEGETPFFFFSLKSKERSQVGYRFRLLLSYAQSKVQVLLDCEQVDALSNDRKPLSSIFLNGIFAW